MSSTTTSGGSLRTYLITRILLVIPMILILVTLVFFLMRVVGDPVSAALGGRLPADQIAERRASAGLDEPIWTQYFEYIGGLLQGDFGTAFTDNRQISSVLLENGAATLELAFWAFLIALAVGIPLGRLAARYRDRPADVGLRIVAVLMYAAPVFFVGMVLKLIFASKLGWFYGSGRASPRVELALQNVSPKTNILIIDSVLYGEPSYTVDVILHTVLPAVSLGLLTAGFFLRLVRTNLLQTLRSDYVEAARARGVPEKRVIRRHAFRNAFVPVVTVMGLQAAMLLGGSILTETTFEWKGLGYTLAQYLLARDFIAVQGIATAIAVVFVFASLFIDIVTAVIDPRVRY